MDIRKPPVIKLTEKDKAEIREMSIAFKRANEIADSADYEAAARAGITVPFDTRKRPQPK